MDILKKFLEHLHMLIETKPKAVRIRNTIGICVTKRNQCTIPNKVGLKQFISLVIWQDH